MYGRTFRRFPIPRAIADLKDGRALSDGERILLQDTLHRSLRKIFAEAGLSHPRFVKLARELSPEGAARLSAAMS